MTHAQTKVRATVKIDSIHVLTVDLGCPVCANGAERLLNLRCLISKNNIAADPGSG